MGGDVYKCAELKDEAIRIRDELLKSVAGSVSSFYLQKDLESAMLRLSESVLDLDLYKIANELENMR